MSVPRSCRVLLPALIVLAALTAPRTARADDSSFVERPFAVGAYASGWAGSYLAGGLGARLRWQPFAELGFDVFGEGVLVDWPGATRHDWQVGFDLYVPIRLGSGVRLRPLFGFCTVLSFIEPPAMHVPRADDVLFGLHAGIGVEIAIVDPVSFFADAQGVAWLGHQRTTQGWTATIEDSYAAFGTARLIVGVQAHIAP